MDGGLADEPLESVDQYTPEYNTLPSHFKRQARPPVNAGMFSQNQGVRNRRSPNRSLSLSSGETGQSVTWLTM